MYGIINAFLPRERRRQRQQPGAHESAGAGARRKQRSRQGSLRLRLLLRLLAPSLEQVRVDLARAAAQEEGEGSGAGENLPNRNFLCFSFQPLLANRHVRKQRDRITFHLKKESQSFSPYCLSPTLFSSNFLVLRLLAAFSIK